MIDIEGDKIYMTLGEACYVLKKTEGAPELLCFGPRVEPEDDMTALGPRTTAAELTAESVTISRGGKRISPEFSFAGVQVCEKPMFKGRPNLRGGKTVKVELTAAKDVTVELYYTPYVRGGIAKRAVVKNTGKTAIELSALELAPDIPGKREKLFNGLSVVRSDGGVYGFARQYVASGAEFPAISIGPGESAALPELLCTYSESADGATRILHDIMREYGAPQSDPVRRPITLLCPVDGDAAQLTARVKAAAETGIDTFVVDVAAAGKVKWNELTACLREHGLKTGLWINDVTAGALAGDLKKLIEKAGASYLGLNCGKVKDHASSEAMWELYIAMRESFPELSMDLCFDVRGDVKQRLKSCVGSPVPLSMVRNTVSSTGAFKTEFDIATFGALGYALDPTELSDGMRRAIRAQVFSYQDDAALIMSGDVYDIGGGVMVVSKDKSKAYAATVGDARFAGLDAHNLYHVRELDKTFSGAALMYYGIASDGGDTVTYHIRQVADYEA